MWVPPNLKWDPYNLVGTTWIFTNKREFWKESVKVSVDSISQGENHEREKYVGIWNWTWKTLAFQMARVIIFPFLFFLLVHYSISQT